MQSVETKKEEARKASRDLKPWIALAAVALLVLVFGFGIYRLQWDGTVTRVMTRVVPYPAAIVDGGVIRWSEFQENVRFLEAFYEAEKARVPAGSILPTREEIEARVLDRLIKEKLAERLARRYGIAISSADVNRAYETSILDQSELGTPSGKAAAEAKAERTLSERYGMSSARFKNDVLYPFLVRRELEAAIRADEELNAEKRRKAEEALVAVRGGMDFGEAVLLYSEDQTAANTAGDRGFLPRGLLPPEADAAVFALEPGEVSDVIMTDLGYHVFRAEARRQQAGETTAVHVREILVKPIGLDAYLEAQKKRVTIITFTR